MFHQKFFRHQWCRHTWPQNKIAKYLVNIWKKLRCNTCEEVTTNLFCLGFLALVVFALRVGDGGNKVISIAKWIPACRKSSYLFERKHWHLHDEKYHFCISLLVLSIMLLNMQWLLDMKRYNRYTTLPCFLKEAHTEHLSKVLKDVFRHSWSA